jgi:hypothetical protein
MTLGLFSVQIAKNEKHTCLDILFLIYKLMFQTCLLNVWHKKYTATCEGSAEVLALTRDPQVPEVWRPKRHTETYSGPSSYDRLDIRTTWVMTKKISFDLRPKSWVTTRVPVKATWVTTLMAFVSFSLNPDTRVCGRNSGQCIALYNYFR